MNEARRGRLRNKSLTVEEGHVDKADLRVVANAKTWLSFLAKEKNLVWALLRRKIRLQGRPQLLVAFGKYFPA